MYVTPEILCWHMNYLFLQLYATADDNPNILILGYPNSNLNTHTHRTAFKTGDTASELLSKGLSLSRTLPLPLLQSTHLREESIKWSFLGACFLPWENKLFLERLSSLTKNEVPSQFKSIHVFHDTGSSTQLLQGCFSMRCWQSG